MATVDEIDAHGAEGNTAGLESRSLYIHLPWCLRKCPYCDFNSHQIVGTLPEKRYVEAVLDDLERDLERVEARPISSVFIGGGTPSLFSAASMERLLEGVQHRCRLVAGCEVTVEVNPGALDASRFRDYQSAGINRLSVGVQSFDHAALRRIGRIHDGREAELALERAARAGFENLNIDLMYGLPGQSPDQALADIETALEWNPAHISHYQLTIEPNTEFHRAPPALPDEDAIEETEVMCAARLAAGGFTRYEVSAWARPSARCQHNLNYWRFGDYLGVGAGAHAKLSDVAGGLIERTLKQKHPRRYLMGLEDGEYVLSRRVVSPPELPLEFMINALRLTEGISMATFEARTGLSRNQIAGGLGEAERRGLLVYREDVITPTPLGHRYLNDLTGLFLPPAGEWTASVAK